jgi:drug/metabolite transporter (DMT)-like permease
MSHKKALVLLAVTASLWSIGGILIKSVALHPLAIAGVRSAIAGLVVLIFIRRLPKFNWSGAQIGATLCFVLTVTLFVTATKMTTAANAILLQYTAPIHVAILSWPLLGEKVRKKDWLALIAMTIGMTLFFYEDVAPKYFWGNIIALCSGVSFAGIALFLRMDKIGNPLSTIFLGHLLTALVGLPFLIGAETPDFSQTGILLALGVFQLGIPYILYGLAIRHVTALEAALIPVIEPVLNPIWVLLFLGEKPDMMALVGGVIVVTAVSVHSFVSR